MTSNSPDPAEFPVLPGLPRQWTITTSDGRTVTGYLPPWAGDDPSEHNVPADQLADRLADIHHTARFPGQRINLYSAPGPTGRPTSQEIFSCTIDCTPYAFHPDPRMPVANVHLCEETWITDLDPDGLLNLAHLLRAQADRLDHEIRPALLSAITTWPTP
ncbi:DUF6907 domain-containing protein [Actinacidiphila sp. bgisy144]|uniref:DUF6907 domain-containing protein n=1 Tax=Actinacidiphila sp. bgisy144 TaxID=3413791 RepID=UPI003EB6A97C